MSDYMSKSALIELLRKDRELVYSHVFCHVECQHEEELALDLEQFIENQPTVDEKEIIRKPFERVINQLNGLMPIKFNGFGKTLITVEDVIKILKEECGINE